jgi:hypothetical protein
MGKKGGKTRVTTFPWWGRGGARRVRVWCALLIGVELSASNGRGGGSGTWYSGRATAAGRF